MTTKAHIADFQVGRRSKLRWAAGLKTCDTAGSEVCATPRRSRALICALLLCAFETSAHPGHSPLQGGPGHQLTHFEHWLPLLLIIAACTALRFIWRKKL